MPNLLNNDLEMLHRVFIVFRFIFYARHVNKLFITIIHQIVKTFSRALCKFSSLEEEDDFSEIITVSEILPKSEHSTVSVSPDLSKIKVKDIFWKLVSIFLVKKNMSH